MKQSHNAKLTPQWGPKTMIQNRVAKNAQNASRQNETRSAGTRRSAGERGLARLPIQHTSAPALPFRPCVIRRRRLAAFTVVQLAALRRARMWHFSPALPGTPEALCGEAKTCARHWPKNGGRPALHLADVLAMSTRVCQCPKSYPDITAVGWGGVGGRYLRTCKLKIPT